MKEVENTIRELSDEETTAVSGGGFKQYEPYVPPGQDPFPTSPIETVKHKIHY